MIYLLTVCVISLGVIGYLMYRLLRQYEELIRRCDDK